MRRGEGKFEKRGEKREEEGKVGGREKKYI